MSVLGVCRCFTLFYFTAPAPTEIYTLSLHDALPICAEQGEDLARLEIRAEMHERQPAQRVPEQRASFERVQDRRHRGLDRKSTRLNSSHMSISYAVFCLKKKKCQMKRRPEAVAQSNV